LLLWSSPAISPQQRNRGALKFRYNQSDQPESRPTADTEESIALEPNFRLQQQHVHKKKCSLHPALPPQQQVLKHTAARQCTIPHDTMTNEAKNIAAIKLLDKLIAATVANPKPHLQGHTWLPLHLHHWQSDRQAHPHNLSCKCPALVLNLYWMHITVHVIRADHHAYPRSTSCDRCTPLSL
jgi:hypothetical protein